MPLLRRVAAEALGTAFLLAVVVGSGIMAERLSGRNVAPALPTKAVTTGAGLFALVQMFAGVSGAHFSPAVSIAMALHGNLATGETLGYIAAQVARALADVASTHGTPCSTCPSS